MLGFGKKKKKAKNKKGVSEKNIADTQQKKKDAVESDTTATPRKKKWLYLKKISIILILLLTIGLSSYAAYKFYIDFSKNKSKKVAYKQIALTHVNLPEEMLQFSFYHLPDLYIALVAYNHEMDLFDREIARIEAIGKTYPDQKKITDKEQKIWIKAQSSLEKTFLKIEKPVRQTYVLFQVNKEQGIVMVKTKHKELTDFALSALVPANEMTSKIQSDEPVPRGLINKTLYKLKKKFL